MVAAEFGFDHATGAQRFGGCLKGSGSQRQQHPAVKFGAQFDPADLALGDTPAGGRRDQVYAPQQAGHFRGQRVVVKMAGRPGLDQAPADHRTQFARKTQRVGKIVGHEQAGHAGLGQHVADLPAHLRAQEHVKVCKRFIQQDDVRLAGKGSRNCGPLALAAGEFVRKATGQS